MTLPCAVRPERGALPPTLLRWASGRGQSPRAALPETPGRLLGEAACVLLLLGVVAWFFAPLVSGAAIVVERDALTAVLPVKLFLARALAAAEPPWWNPAPALGKPFLADPLPGALYPGNLLLLAGSFARAYDLFTVAHYAWTALGAFLLLRAARLPRAAALLGAVVWALGGALVSLANVVNHLSAAAWLPWVLWAWTRPRRHAAKVAAASLALAMPVLCGSPEMALLAAAALVLWSEDARSLLVPPLALGLAAAEVVPVFAYLRETWRGVHGFSADAAMRLSATPAQLVQLVRAGGPLEPETFLASVYVGLPVAGLALVGLLGASRRRAAVCAALGLGIAALALGPRTPLLPLLYAHLPFADLLRYPGKLLVALHGLIALGAAFGCARLLALVRGRGGGLGGSRAAAVLGGLLVVLVAVDLAEENRGLARGEPTDEVLTPPAAARAMLDDAARASEAAPGAAAGEPGSEPGDSDPAGPVRYYASPSGAPRASSASDAVRLDRALLVDASGELFGLADVNTPSSLNLVAHERLEQALAAAGRDGALDTLAALGVRYVTTWVPLDGSASARELPLPGAGFAPRLYRLEGAAPRAFVARRVVVAGDALGALGRFALAGPGRHEGLAVLEASDAAGLPGEITGEGQGSMAPAGSGPTSGLAAPVRWIADRANRLELEVTLERAGLLVVSDTHAAGWSATVDGEPASIVRVNGLVRGVALAAGTHRVAMRYVPPGLVPGATISIVVAGSLAAMVAFRRKPSRFLRAAPG